LWEGARGRGLAHNKDATTLSPTLSLREREF